MKVLEAKVNWHEQFDNAPSLEILVDKLVDQSKLIYRQKNNLYYAEREGYVSFFYNVINDNKGYAGREFKLKMEDGIDAVTLKGPYSSRSGIVNSLGFGPCLEVAIVDDLKSFERGYTFYAGAVTLDVGHIASSLAGVELVEVCYNCEITYKIFHPTRTICMQCKSFSYDKFTKKGKACRYCKFDRERSNPTSIKHISPSLSNQQAGSMP